MARLFDFKVNGSQTELTKKYVISFETPARLFRLRLGFPLTTVSYRRTMVVFF